MTNSTVSRYWKEARAPRYSLSFAFPLLLAYEALAFTLSRSEVSGVRNGADVLLKSLFLMLGGRDGLAVFGVLLVGGGAAVIWKDYRRSGQIQPRYFAWMAAESVLYALMFGVVASTLTVLLLPGLSILGNASALAVGIAGRVEPADPADDFSRGRDLRGAAVPGDPRVGARVAGDCRLRLGRNPGEGSSRCASAR